MQCSFTAVDKSHKPDRPPQVKDNLVIECSGVSGDPTGSPPKEAPPEMTSAPVVRLDLSCDSTLDSTKLSKGHAGTTVLGRCPSGCRQNANIFGSNIYSADSAICTAAAHDGSIPDTGGDVVITVGHPQDIFLGTNRNGVESLDKNGREVEKSFVLSVPTIEVLARVAKTWSSWYAGASAFGAQLFPRKVEY